MLGILDSLQKLALMLDKPLNAERRAKLADLHQFFTKVTIERPALKENLIIALKYVCCVYDRFPVPFKLSIFSTAPQYSLYVQVRAFNRVPAATKFLDATNPPVECSQNSFFGPSNYQLLPLPPRLNFHDGISIDDFGYDSPPLPVVTDVIKEKAAFIVNVPLYGVSHCAIEDIEMAVAIIEMVNMADDVVLLRNRSFDIRQIISTLVPFRDLFT